MKGRNKDENTIASIQIKHLAYYNMSVACQN